MGYQDEEWALGLSMVGAWLQTHGIEESGAKVKERVLERERERETLEKENRRDEAEPQAGFPPFCSS